MRYDADQRIVMTLDAGGTNFVFSAIQANREIIKPKVICTLGKFASQTLLNSEVPISRLRGQFHEYRGIKLMPTYHPAFLLRNSSGKKEVWEDMKKIAKEIGIKIPKKQ